MGVDLTTLHADHAPFVWRSLQRLGVRDVDLEDTLQEVFIVVHRRLDSFDGSSKPTTWLFGICLRIAAAYHRRAHRRHEDPVEDMDREQDGAAASPEEQATRREAVTRLQHALDAMPLDKRAVFVMFEIDGMNCQEIASVLDVPVGTVYSRLHAARSEFQRSLRREDLKSREAC